MLKKTLAIIFFIQFGMVAYAQQDAYNEFYSLDSVNELHLKFYHEFWRNKLIHYKKNYKKKRLPAKLTINGIEYDSTAVRFKGNSSFFSSLKNEELKLPINIDSDKFVDDRLFNGNIEKIKLSNIFYDPSYVREVLAYQIARDYMPAPNCNFAYLSIDTTEIGLYTCSESIDGHFLTRKFGYDKGTLIKCDPEWHQPLPQNCETSENASLEYLGNDAICYKPYYESKSEKPDDWNNLIQLCKQLQDNPDGIGNILNVDAVLWMHAFNAVFVNLDSYTGRFCHNYYLFQDSFGVFQPLVWDMNMAFGGFRFSDKAKPLSLDEMRTMSVFLHINNDARPLIKNILRIKKYRQIYLDHVRTIYEDWIVNEKYLEEAKNLIPMIQPFVEMDQNALYQNLNIEDFLYDSYDQEGIYVPGIKELMLDRGNYLSTHPVISRESASISSVSHKQSDSLVSVNVEHLGAVEVVLYYRSKQNAPFKSQMQLVDAGLPVEFRLNKEEIKQYYIIVFSDDSADCYPSKAAFAPIDIE